MLGEFGPQSRTVFRLVERRHGDLREQLVEVARHGGRQVLAGQFLVLAVDRGGQFLIRVLALVPHGQFALLSADHVVEQGLDLRAEVPFHVVGPERRAFQPVRHVRAPVCFHGLVMIGVVRGVRLVGGGARHLGEVFLDVAHAMVLSPWFSCHALVAVGRRSSNPSRHHARFMYMIMRTSAGAWPNGSTSA